MPVIVRVAGDMIGGLEHGEPRVNGLVAARFSTCQRRRDSGDLPLPARLRRFELHLWFELFS